MNNARRYNKPETSYHKLAISVGEAAEPILSELDDIDRNDSVVSIHSTELTKLLETNFVEELFSYHFEESIREPTPPAVEELPAAVIEEIEEEVVAMEEEVEVEKVVEVELKSPAKKGKKGKGKAVVVQEDEEEEEVSTPKPKAKAAGKKRKLDEAALDPSPAPSRSRRSDNIEPIASTSALKSTPTTSRKAKIEPEEVLSDSGIIRKKGRAKAKGRVSELQGIVRTPALIRSSSATALNHVLEVDARSSFKLFESGSVSTPPSLLCDADAILRRWVLPEGSSRRPTNASTPITAPRPSKSIKVDSLAMTTPASRKGKAKAVLIDEDTPMLEIAPVVDEEETKLEAEEDEGDMTIGGANVQLKKKRGTDAEGNSFATVKKIWEAKVHELAGSIAITKKTKLEDGAFLPFPSLRRN